MKRFGTVIKEYALYVRLAPILCILLVQQALSGTDGMTLRKMIGPIPYAEFGRSVASAGDVNGDGYPDIIIGSYSGGSGRAYIFFGGPAMDTIPDVILTNHSSNDYFGISVAGAGDVNGDGYDDVVVGAYVSGDLGLDSGHVYIFFGGPAMDSIPDVVIAGLPSELFGISVAGAGDVNGDGYADVIVGAPGNDAGGLDGGRAYIFFGGATMDNVPDVIITGTVPTEDLGNSVAGAGDVNGDGFDDVIVGAYTNDLVGGNNGGKAYLYLGGSHMDNVVDVTFNGSAAFDYFGVCVAGVGDVNNDGYDDVLISARGVNVRGRTSIYFGGPVMNNVPDVTLNGEVDYNYFGESAAGAGDINGDGYADVIIGAFGNNSYTGKVYIYYGGASMDTIPDLTFTGEAASDRFGGSVSGAGDVNGDGFNDAIVGAWYAGATTEGKAYLYLSSAGPLPIQLAGFSGTSIGNDQVRLNWTTLSEVNNYGFEVQRRQTGGPEFQTLPNSFTPGHGTTIEPHSYSFTDPTASAGQWAYRLKQIDLDGSLHYSELVNVRVLTSVEGDAVPARFTLEQNYPNPFNPSTTIRYELPHASQVSLKVYNTLGQEVATLVNETKAAGVYTAEFDAAGLASGVYFYRMQAGTFVEVKKLVVLR